MSTNDRYVYKSKLLIWWRSKKVCFEVILLLSWKSDSFLQAWLVILQIDNDTCKMYKIISFLHFITYISLKFATFWPCLKTGQTFSKTFKNQLLNAFQLGNDKKKSKKIQCINARRTISNELKHWKELLEFMKVEHKMSWTLNFNTSKNLANSLNWTRCFPSCYNNHSI